MRTKEMKRRNLTPEDRARRAAVMNATRARFGPGGPHTGHKHSEVAKAKMAAWAKTHGADTAERNRQRVWTDDAKARVRAANKARGPASRESRAKMSEAQRRRVEEGRHFNPAKVNGVSAETRAKISQGNAGKPKSAEHRQKLVKNLARIKADPVLRTRMISASARGQSLHPNKLERKVLAALIDAFPDTGWKFNDGLVVNGKVPDFVRSDNLPVVVDVHGDYWHQGEDDRVRRKWFRDAGYLLVVIWEREFKAQPYLLRARVRRAIKSAQKGDS